MSDLSPQSGLIVEIPEAEHAVQQYRQALDSSAPLGVPAHFTVLFPFMLPDQIDSIVLNQLRELFAGVKPFEVELTHTAWFEDAVLWVAPEDPEPFRSLTEIVFDAFPGFPPFGGQFDEVVPHLTVAHGSDLVEMRAAERAVAARLPICARPRKVTLITQTQPGGHWYRTSHFPFAGTND